MKRLILIMALCLSPIPALAQDGRAGGIAGLIEDALSDGDARQVRIEGFAGALSSQARLDRLTVSDTQGVWLILEDAQLDWNRSALLRGALDVNTLTAARLQVLRPPVPGGGDLPDAAATPFSLPDLPVSIDIGRVAIDRVELGEPVIGLQASLTIAGSAALSGGNGQVEITSTRLDGPGGEFILAAAYSNDRRDLSVDLLLAEDAGGLAAELLNLPGAPSLRLAVTGAGPIDDFIADITLATDGAPRVTGTVTTRAPEGQARITDVDIGGDVTPLFLPQYQAFFGPDVRLTAQVVQSPDGAVALENLRLSAAALSLSGNVMIDAAGRPDRIAITGRISDDTARVRLPGTDATITDALLSLTYDSSLGDDWHGNFHIRQLAAAAFDVDQVDLTLNGSFTEGDTGLTGVTADIAASLTGLGHKNADIATAMGNAATLDAALSWTAGAPVLLRDLVVATDTLSLEGTAAANLQAEELRITLETRATAPSLVPFSGLAGQDLSGAVDLSLSGSIAPLSGAFDLNLAGTGTDLGAGDALPPGLLAGDTDLMVTAVRDETGLRLEAFSIDGTQISAMGSGAVLATSGALDLTARLADVGLFTDTLSGPATADLSLRRDGDAPWNVTADLTAPAAITATATGTLSTDAVALDVAARIGNIGTFTNQISGPVTADLTIDGPISGPLRIDGDLTGPAGMQATVAGSVLRPDGTVDLDIAARLPLSLANRALDPRSLDGTLQANLAISGPPGLSAISGSFSTTGARISLPTLQSAVEGLTVSGSLSQGQVQFTANGTLASGGAVTAQGRATLTAAGIPGDITITLRDARIIDPLLYEARITTADLRFSGALAGSSQLSGTVNLGETEIRVPETSIGTGGDIPDIRHLNESAAERRTRLFAGLLAENGGNGRGGGRIGLDITVNAPDRVFLRGRGLDAELGGSVRLLGSTANIIPAGRFDLIRGRLSILGTRLDLDEGSATLRGDLNPYLRLVASSGAGEYTIFITLEGPASEPTVAFSSDPDLPDDEVLAQLLFGRSVSALSPLQALQLANAATSLAGGSTNAGLLSNLREGLGLDDLDLETDAEGNAGLRAGRYLSENVYTDVTIGADGEADLSLNIDLTPDIAARGTFSSDGSSSLGVFFERDY